VSSAVIFSNCTEKLLDLSTASWFMMASEVAQMYTISELGRMVGLSRTALLYYESIGLLTPAERTSAGYRLYSDASAELLTRICTYRNAGVPLSEIAAIVSQEETVEAAILEKTLDLLNKKELEIKSCKQRLTSMIGNTGKGSTSLIDLDSLKFTFALAGIGDDVLLAFHSYLESDSHEQHIALLRLLGFDDSAVNELLERINEEKTNA